MLISAPTEFQEHSSKVNKGVCKSLASKKHPTNEYEDKRNQYLYSLPEQILYGTKQINVLQVIPVYVKVE